MAQREVFSCLVFVAEEGEKASCLSVAVITLLGGETPIFKGFSGPFSIGISLSGGDEK
jgi:hypothetical protein